MWSITVTNCSFYYFFILFFHLFIYYYYFCHVHVVFALCFPSSTPKTCVWVLRFQNGWWNCSKYRNMNTLFLVVHYDYHFVFMIMGGRHLDGNLYLVLVSWIFLPLWEIYCLNISSDLFFQGTQPCSMVVMQVVRVKPLELL